MSNLFLLFLILLSKPIGAKTSYGPFDSFQVSIITMNHKPARDIQCPINISTLFIGPSLKVQSIDKEHISNRQTAECSQPLLYTIKASPSRIRVTASSLTLPCLDRKDHTSRSSYGFSFISFLFPAVFKKTRKGVMNGESRGKDPLKMDDMYKLIERQYKAYRLSHSLKEITNEIHVPSAEFHQALDRMRSKHLSDCSEEKVEWLHKNLSKMHDYIHRLLSLVEDGVDCGDRSMAKAHIVELIEKLIPFFKPMIKNYGCSLALSSSKGPCVISADHFLVEDILFNLLFDAIDYVGFSGHIFMETIDDGVCVSVTTRCRRSFEEGTHSLEGTKHGYTCDADLCKHISSIMKREDAKLLGNIDIQPVADGGLRISVMFKKNTNTDGTHLKINHDEKETLPSTYEEKMKDVELTLSSRTYPNTICVVGQKSLVSIRLIEMLCQNFHVMTASDGQEAYVQICETESVSMVLCNVRLKTMSGYDFCRMLKLNPKISYIPVILFSEQGSEKDDNHLWSAAGARGLFRAPFRLNDVRALIIRIIEERNEYKKRLLDDLYENNYLLVPPQNIESSDESFLRRIIQILEQNYSSSDLNVESMSAEMGISRTQLYRKVCGLLGCTPVEYIREFRLKKAVSLIKMNKYSYSEIAYMVGFSSPAYFTKCFKDFFGMTPSDYKA